jgi:putative PIN family toxin of toxin-antitoxin system
LARVVVDTSVIVSAFLQPAGTSRKAFTEVTKKHQLLISVETVQELNAVLLKPKFQDVFNSTLRAEIFSILLRVGEVVEVRSGVALSRDPSDDKFLNLAIDGGADFLISRDPDLLTLKKIKTCRILSPADYMSEFAAS